ncbi:hypothetical protein KC343_g11323, partial [Hortaea werneckii]
MTDRLYSNIDSDQIQKQADTCLLHYGTAFHSEIITSASGQWLTTASGHRMLDWTSGQMSCLIGHCHPEIAQTITSHATHLDHLFSGMLSPPVV